MQRVVDHAEVVLVVEEPRVGVDLSVDADPELHVALQLRRAWHGVVLRQGARDREAAHGRENPPAPGERPSDHAVRARRAPCRVHLHSCKRKLLMQVQGLVAHLPPVTRPCAPSNASGILTLPGVARRFGPSGRAPPPDDQARALLTTRTASQLREPRRTTCRTAAVSGSVGMSVALITASAREASRGHGIIEQESADTECSLDGSSDTVPSTG